MTTSRVAGPLKWHGGKSYLASRLVALMPPHLHYVEPFAGGLAVLLAKNPEGISEVVNDLSLDLTTFWRVLQHADLFRDFLRVVQAVPFSEVEYQDACSARVFASEVDRAVAFFVRCRMSLAGRMRSFTGITKTRTRRGMNNEVSAWLSAVEGLPVVHERLRRVLILNRDALEVIRDQDRPDTLFYCDPPYLQQTRTLPEVYAHEMTCEQHKALLDTILACQGKVILSGYSSDLYDARLASWRVVDFDLPNHAAGGASKRRMVERCWLNF